MTPNTNQRARKKFEWRRAKAQLHIWFTRWVAKDESIVRLVRRKNWPTSVNATSTGSRIPAFYFSRDKQQAAWQQLLTLEYEKAAERYDNIYKAVWQNFSYMAILSAAILTFGAKELAPWSLLFFALAPIAFWYAAQFIPMDKYGERTRDRLDAIESQLNAVFFPRPGDPRLSHFIQFRQQRGRAKFKPLWRVKDVVHKVGIIVLLGTLGGSAMTLLKWQVLKSPNSTPMRVVVDSARISFKPELSAAQTSFNDLSRQNDSMSVLLYSTVKKLDSISNDLRYLKCTQSHKGPC
jgi:hypothetical protein